MGAFFSVICKRGGLSTLGAVFINENELADKDNRERKSQAQRGEL